MLYPICDATILMNTYNVGSYIANLLMVEPMHGASVNGWVDIPLLFVIMIYFTVITVTTMSFVYFVKKKNPFVQALRKSIVIALFCSGFLYLVYSERIWYNWFSHDVETYFGKSTEEKTFIDFGSIYDFAMAAQNVLKDSEYTLYASNKKSFSLIAEYYLLPRRNRTNSKNILVFYDTDAVYDDRAKSFIKGDIRIENAEMIFRYDADAYILRVR